MKEGARTDLIGHLVDIPTGEWVTLAGLPALPVIPVDEHRLPLAFVVGPLRRALESAYGLFEPNQNRKRREGTKVNVHHQGKGSILGHLSDSACPFLARSRKASRERKSRCSSSLGW